MNKIENEEMTINNKLIKGNLSKLYEVKNNFRYVKPYNKVHEVYAKGKLN
jgi:hypothetical protein